MSKGFSTNTQILYSGGFIEGDTLRPETPAIYNSTAYVVRDTLDYDSKNNEQKGFFYNRTRNPNRESLGEAISFLEKGEKTLILSSGMAAISTTILSLVKQGDHILASSSIYGETIELMKDMLPKFGIDVNFVDFTNPSDVKTKMKPNTKILYTEIVANPLLSIVDIREISKISKEADVLLIIDNTFTTPYTISPIEFGADVVIHSLTKFLNGHSDVTAGSITSSTEIINKIIPSYLLLGSCADANSSWLCLRGIRTFSMRMKQQCQNALKLAEFLESDKRVRKVNYPGLDEHPQHNIAMETFKQGFGPMISFLVEDDRAKVDKFIRKLNMIEYLGTLGGYRTSLAHPATAFRFEFTKEELVSMGMTEGLIRISVGAEEAEDLIEDIKQALDVFK